MAQYTVELRKLIETGFDIGLKDYPIYKEELRANLNKMIINHYYFREIAVETPERFKFYLNRKMNEIMPYYNQILKSEDLEYNPLYNIEIIESFKRNVNSKGKSNNKMDSNGNVISNNTTNNKVSSDNITVQNDTPQSELSKEDIKSNKYASQINYDNVDNNFNEVTDLTNNSTQNINSFSDSDMSNVEDYIKETKGSSAGLAFSTAIKKWRDVMINTNMMIINELEVCFMQLW